MPQNIFNLYSAVAFADQSLATWPLDDDFSFISLIGASPVWTVTGGASATNLPIPKEKPQETVGIADVGIFTYNFSSSSSAMTIKSQNFSNQNTDSNKPTVCINAFIYNHGSTISSIEIGFEYSSTTTYSTYTNIAGSDWTRITHTTQIPDSNQISPYIKIYSNSASVSIYNFSVGQWSELANHVSTGFVPTNFSSLSSSSQLAQSWGTQFSASPSIYKVYEVDSYGFTDDNGYYIIENNKMLADNINMPMVYGSGNITDIRNSNYGAPSLVFPSKSFLHDGGKYSNYTAEFWMRIAPSASNEIRIFGPTSGLDGLYVNKNFITIKIGPYSKSFFIGKWYRPMLVHFLYSRNEVSLMINGSTVIDQKIDIDDIEFAHSDNEWLGFYSDSTIKNFEIDAFSIYSYLVTPNMAKRKLVYGQGVDNINDIVKKFNGNAHTIDFPFAKYSKNFIYPDSTPWVSGFQSNLEAQDRYLGFMEYELPQITSYGEDLSGFIKNRDIRSWRTVLQNTWEFWKNIITWQKLRLSREMQLLYDNYQNQESSNEKIYFNLKPNSSYANINSAIVFTDANPLSDPVGSFIGIFSINKYEIEYGANSVENNGLNQSELIISEFKNMNNDIFKICISDINLSSRTFKIKYYINSFQINSQVEETLSYSSSLYEDLYFVVGLDIKKINTYAALRLKNYFKNMNMLQLSIGGNSSNQFTGKIHKFTFNNMFFTSKDIENYFDENGFAKKGTSCNILSNDSIFDYIGNYTLFFKKANQSIIMDIGSSGYWQTSIPLYQLGSYVTKSDGSQYFDLDLIQFNIDIPYGFTYSDEQSSDICNSYISIQRYQDIGTIPYSNYSQIESLNGNKYIDFDEFSKSQLDIKKFEIINGTVIFPPKNVVDFKDMYMTFHIELKTNGINTNPIQLQSMSICSLSYDGNILYPVGTQSGNNIYPFTRQSLTYSPKIKNPFLIYKDSTPYLYLTSDSGIEVLPYPESDNLNLTRGISVPINSNKNDAYYLYGFQLWMLYKDSYSINDRKKIFNLYINNEDISFYLEPEYGNKRAKLKSYTKTIVSTNEIDYGNVILHQNGIKQSVYLSPLEWSLITVEFISPINLSSISGQLELYPGALFNNVTIFNSSISNIVDDIFESHLGLSNIVAQDETVLSIDSELLEYYNDIKWTNFSGRPL